MNASSPAKHWREVKKLFLQAIELPAEKKDAWLDQLGDDDPDLRREVEAMLAAAHDAEDFIEAPALAAFRPPRDRSSEERFIPGTVLAKRYRIVTWIASGGMGEIYRADDLTLKQRVALKFLPESLERSPTMLARLVGEIKLARQVSHPNVCRVYDFAEIDGHPFLSMEYIDGLDLADLLRQSGRLAMEKASELAEQLASGLAAIHRQDILHRDLKPANVMIDRRGHLKITDFGIARLAEELAPETTAPEAASARREGTPSYMAPEQHAGQALTPKCDLYALGLVMHELFTGQRASKAAELTSELDPAIERLIASCLRHDPHRRPASAEAVVAVLRKARGDDPAPALPRLRLRSWAPSEWPEAPYPLLLPYAHPRLLAGRERDLAELQRLLRLNVPVLGIYAASGTGKSSLVTGGLLPALRAAGCPVAFDNHPQEGNLAQRLIGDLLQTDEAASPEVAAADPRRFALLLRQAHELAGRPPVLVVDQLEMLLRAPDDGRSLALFGLLLAAAVERQPGLDAPLCRWLLVYRHDFHGEVIAWLGDVLHQARRHQLAAAAELPFDLSGHDRFHGWPLLPLATPRRGSDPLSEPLRVFRQAIAKPLAVTTPDGAPRYPWCFAGDGAERLARAFAEARLARPEAPLVPELQVVLANLLARAADVDDEGRRRIHVPEDARELIKEALANHLRGALEEIFPTIRHSAVQDRARALLVLRELAEESGRRRGLPEGELRRAFGHDGADVLAKLAGPRARLIVLERVGEDWCYALAHDRLAEVVVELVEEEVPSSELAIDRDLLALRQQVRLHTELFLSGDAQRATRLAGAQQRRIAAHTEALLWSEEQRRWWAACQQRQRAGQRWRAAGMVTLVFFAAILVAAAWWIVWYAERQALLDKIAWAEPAAALQAFTVLDARHDVEPAELLAGLRQRKVPLELVERGLGRVGDNQRSATVLRVVEIALPLFAESPEDSVLIASAAWALDFFPGRDPRHADAARALRDEVLAPLRRLRPPPPLPAPADPDWVFVPGGTFWMGTSPRDGLDEAEWLQREQPKHQVTVSPFRMLAHEVTHEEYRRLVPGHRGEDDLPVGATLSFASSITWYSAYAYAAWIGGRLPTEAEWEHAARAGCPYDYCTRSGTETTLSKVGWFRFNSFDPKALKRRLRPAGKLEPNPFGLFDMYGSLWEWTSDWYGLYSDKPESNPPGPFDGPGRVYRGGSYFSPVEIARAGYRAWYAPNQGNNLAIRVVLSESHLDIDHPQERSP